MTSRDTIDILNRKEFFYYDKPPKTPEIEKQDREQTERDFALIRKDLEVLENIKSKTLLFYSDRKKIAEEYEKWCKDNNAMISDTTNMITWVLCFKLKEWLNNEK